MTDETETTVEESPKETAITQLSRAASHLDIDDDVLAEGYSVLLSIDEAAERHPALVRELAAPV